MECAINITELEGWLGTLKECKQLPEDDIRKLCEKVSFIIVFKFLLLSVLGLVKTKSGQYPSLWSIATFIFSELKTNRM